jgi:hypothetical protein
MKHPERVKLVWEEIWYCGVQIAYFLFLHLIQSQVTVVTSWSLLKVIFIF